MISPPPGATVRPPMMLNRASSAGPPSPLKLLTAAPAKGLSWPVPRSTLNTWLAWEPPPIKSVPSSSTARLKTGAQVHVGGRPGAGRGGAAAGDGGDDARDGVDPADHDVFAARLSR